MYELYQESVLKLLSYKHALGYVICTKQTAFCDVSATEWRAAFENRNPPNNATHYSDPQQEFLNRGSWNMRPQFHDPKYQDEILVRSGVITCEQTDVAKANTQLFLAEAPKTCPMLSGVPTGLEVP
jgi:hypothetical protein